MSRVIDADFLIIGTGISGLYSAYLLSEYGRVVLVTKADVAETNTSYAQGGIASVLDSTDSFEKHIEDTLIAGAGLCDPESVRVLVTEGPNHIRKLMELGAQFEKDITGKLDLGREGGHSERRIVHRGDYTGREIELALVRAVRERGIEIHEHSSVVELIMRENSLNEAERAGTPRCYGAYVYDRNTWKIDIFRAPYTILATGGAGQVYLHNTNSQVATGDGVALAYRAGAVIANMEFYQFHPTSLYSPGHPTFLITEAIRGYGGVLRGYDGEPFMQKYDPRMELAPRDIVARAIDAELKKSGSPHVWLDVTHKPAREIMEKFPSIYETCLNRGIDITKEMIPVVPAAHYMCGGVRTDLFGATTLEGLFAVGEVSCTGVHGGNRLASNSLLEGLVFGGRIAAHLAERKNRVSLPEIRPWMNEGLHLTEEWILVEHNYHDIRKLMWDYVGIVRSDIRLNRALKRINLLIEEIEDFYRRAVIQNKVLELRNLALVAKLIIESAQLRKESRGLHFTTDYPETRTPSQEYTLLSRGTEKLI
jgi:L-aspartate oxidase